LPKKNPIISTLPQYLPIADDLIAVTEACVVIEQTVLPPHLLPPLLFLMYQASTYLETVALSHPGAFSPRESS
jgi:hypothetical protein